MNKIQNTAFLALISFVSVAQAEPGQAECKLTTAIDSPVATFVKLPIILTNPFSEFVFAASSCRNSLCPRPELITREQAQAMVDAAVAQQFELLSKAQQPTVVAGRGNNMWSFSDRDFWRTMFWFAVICALAGWGLSKFIG
jgi:hypothetical protein